MKKLFIIILISFFNYTNSYSQQWNSIGGTGVQNSTVDYTSVYSMIIFNGELYIGGCFTSVNGIPANYIAKFNGTNWSAVGNGLWHTGNNNVIYSGIRSMAVFNGELYVGGIINQSGGTPIYNVAKWNGTSWVAIGDLSAVASGVLSLCVYNNELYAGGNLWGFNSIAKWNGATWVNLGTGMQDSNNNQALVRDMRVFNNLLYIGGQFKKGNGINSENLISWNGTNFDSIGSGAIGIYGVTKLGEFQSKLIVTGGVTSIHGVPLNNIGGFNSLSWNSFSSGVGFPGGNSFETQSIVEHNNKMVVGGFFTMAGTTSVNSIAEWNGSAWNTMGAGITGGYVASLSSFNGELYAGGKFTDAGGISVNNIAKWTSKPNNDLALNVKMKIEIFPNPCKDKINIILPESITSRIHLKVRNSLGCIIIDSEMYYNGIFQLSLENFEQGAYFLNIETEKENYVAKILKM